MSIKNTQIAEELALPPVKIHCSILAEDAIKAAVTDYKAKHANRTSHAGSCTAGPGNGPLTEIAEINANMKVELTEAAVRHITRYLTRRGKGVGIRLG